MLLRDTLDESWRNILNYVLTLPAHQDIAISKHGSPHPLQVGFAFRLGEARGQMADYGVTVSDGRGIHIMEYQDVYLLHWDKADPLTNPIGHILQDAPHYLRILGVLAAAFAGIALFGDSRKS